MTFAEAVRTCLRKYVAFSGRAARPEYWWFVLFYVLVLLAGGIADAIVFGSDATREPISALLQVVLFLPLLAAGWRRIQDTGRPGWYVFFPMSVSFGFGLLSVLGFLAIDTGPDGASDSVVRFGAFWVIGAYILQLVVTVLMIWWLTRPSQPGENIYGPSPQEAK